MMKSFYTSKTIWMGLAIALIPFVQALQALPLSTTQAQIVSGILGVLVVVNRFYTSTQLTVTKPEGDM